MATYGRDPGLIRAKVKQIIPEYQWRPQPARPETRPVAGLFAGVSRPPGSLEEHSKFA